jgi:methylated-DNA-[protein]-cysteine S-methyltransferase
MDAPIAPERSGVPYAVVATPWGPVHVAVSEIGVVALEVLTPEPAFVAGLERRLQCPVVRIAPARNPLLGRAVEELEEFLAGQRRAFDLAVDLAGRSEWDRTVLGMVRRVPWGGVTSYGRLARAIERPGAARAAGGAVGRNPIGLLIPCHRIIAGDGSLGGYGGDWFGSRERLLEIKRELLAREGVDLPATTFAV